MTRLKHTVLLLRETWGYAVVNRAYWIIPTVLLLLAVALVIVVVEAAAPLTLYTLF